MALSPLPGISLHTVQVNLTRLMQLLNVKGGRGGFSLSSAVVPVVDVTSLIEAEFGGQVKLVAARDQNFNADAAPHALTERWRYTVPATKRAIVRSAFTSILRRTAAAPAQSTEANISLARPGGFSGATIAQARLLDNAIGAHSDSNLSQQISLNAGDAILYNTADVSVGGTCNHQGYAVIEEFSG